MQESHSQPYLHPRSKMRVDRGDEDDEETENIPPRTVGSPRTTPCKYAWATLVMKGNNYVPGALVLADSLQRVKTEYDTVCMVTKDVSSEAVITLMKVFDQVLKVPYITHKTVQMRTKRQREMYQDWIHQSFTKWHVLNPAVFRYKKVIMLDADMIFIENCDHLFSMSAPAATFSTPWAKPYCLSGGLPNYYIDTIGRELEHGEIVPRSCIERSRKYSFVCRASVVLIAPSENAWRVFQSILNGVEVFGTRDCFNGFDEQILVDVWLSMHEEIKHIHQRYNWVVGKTQWLEKGDKPHVFQWYGAQRVWHMSRYDWPDTEIWWNRADAVMHQMPESRRFFPIVRHIPPMPKPDEILCFDKTET